MTTHYNAPTAPTPEPLALQLARVADTLRLLTYRLARATDDPALERSARATATQLVCDLVAIAQKCPKTRFLGPGHETTPPTAKQRVCGPFWALSGHICTHTHPAPTPGPAETHDTHAPTHDTPTAGPTTTTPGSNQ